MGEREKAFRQSLRIDNSRVIEEFIKTERAKVVKDKRLSNEQKRERIELLNEALVDMQIMEREKQARATMQAMNESQWEK